MQRQRLKFPIVKMHNARPEKAKQLNITLFYPGLLRIHLNNPKRVMSTDRYRSIRIMRHIQENHIEELNKNKKVLDRVVGKNRELAEKHADISAIKNLTNSLFLVLDSLERMRAPAKVLAFDKLENALGRLVDIENVGNAFEREKIVGPACFEIVAFRNRYDGWRSKEIEGIDEAVKTREDFLYFLRDEFFDEVVENWIKILRSRAPIILNWARDRDYRNQLLEITDGKNVLDNLKPLVSTLERIYNMTYFNEGCSLLEDADKSSKKWVRKNKQDAGRRRIREFALALGTRNPLVVADEVRDDITDDISAYLDEAAISIKNGRYGNAIQCLEEIKTIRSIQTGKS